MGFNSTFKGLTIEPDSPYIPSLRAWRETSPFVGLPSSSTVSNNLHLCCVVLCYVILSIHNSEVCHPRCVFKLYGEVNSVKNTTINIWLNVGFISNGKYQ